MGKKDYREIIVDVGFHLKVLEMLQLFSYGPYLETGYDDEGIF